MKKIFLLIVSLSLLGIGSLSAKSIESWANSIPLQKKRKITQRNTTIAAVRGVEEISDVNSDARSYEGVKKMESQSNSQTEVDNFGVEGKLKVQGIPSVSTAPASGVSYLAEQVPGGTLSEALHPISLEEELELGRAVAANVVAQFGLVQNDPLTRYVNRVGQLVARQCGRPELLYRFAILDSPIINAFAAPGGYIFITRGLLSALKDEAQLAAVLGHEIAHVSQKHVLKEIQKSKLVSATIPNYVKASAKKAQWMNQVTDLAIQMLWKGLSRADELESDQLGGTFAYKSGYYSQALIEVLQMLKSRAQSPKLGKELKFLLSTHPDPETRLQSAQNSIGAYPLEGERLAERFKIYVSQ